jgi:hypothetical protein
MAMREALMLMLLVSSGFVRNAVSADGVQYPEWIMEQVAWSFENKRYVKIEDFREALVKYNNEIDNPLSESLHQPLGMPALIVKFDFAEETNDGLRSIKKIVRIEAKSGNLTALEVLYDLHNAIQHLFDDYDHKYFEGLEFESGQDGVGNYIMFLGS